MLTTKQIRGATAIAALMLAAGAVSSTAATASDTVSSKVAMSIVAAKRVVSGPDAAKNVLVELSDGQTISIPDSMKEKVLNPSRPAPKGDAGGVQTQAVSYGSCGSSYVNLGYKSNGEPVRMTTGFHTNDTSIRYGWNVGISGPPNSGYQYNYTSSGDLAFRNDWNGSHNSGKNYARGTYIASVSTSSYSILYWGGVCTSGGPVQQSNL